MGRKVWLWIIAGLALLLALGVTAAIVLGSLHGDAPEPEVPGTSQEQTQPQEPAPSEEDTTGESAVQEDTTAEATEPAEETTQPTQPTQEGTQEGPSLGPNDTPWG